MAVPALPPGLVSVAELATFVQADVEDDDLFTLNILSYTGIIIRAAAQQPTWTDETIPMEIRVFAIKFAARVWNNPLNQQRRNVGPIGDSYAIQELSGLALTAEDIAFLEGFLPDGSASNGVWSLKISRPDEFTGVYEGNYVPVSNMGLGNVLEPFPSLHQYLRIPGPW
jgi:hypothetical protein